MTPDGTRAEQPATAPLAAEPPVPGVPGPLNPAESRTGPLERVVLVLEYTLDPEASPDAVERAVHGYVRRIQAIPVPAPIAVDPAVHAAIGFDALRVLAVFGR